MKNNKYLLSVLLVLTLFVSLLTLIIIHTFFPMAILPKFDLSSIMLISLIALLINHYINTEKSSLLVILFAFIAFGLLPYASGFVTIVDALILALKGGITFTITMFVFNSIQEHISDEKNIATPIITAVMLYLAVQCLMGIF